MPDREIRLALISGGMYDPLYARIPEFEGAMGVTVRVGFRGTHPELNAHLAAGDDPPYDLISTHTKYAPSQKRFLATLDTFDPSGFFPAVLDLARIGDSLYGVPRNIDLRLLHYRTDLVDSAPGSWDDVARTARELTRAPHLYGFAFTGLESGLFGTFFELVESAGVALFPDSLVPRIDNEGGRWALGLLRELYQSGAVPPEITGWHYDEVHACFRNGGAAMVTDWPGYYGSYTDAQSPVRSRFGVARMPAGPAGRVCCSAGCHTFALTRTGARKEAAHSLLTFLTAPEQQALEARQGSVPVRPSVMERQRQSTADPEAERLALLERSIQSDLIIPPKLAVYPDIEAILWRTVQHALTGGIGITDALRHIEKQIAERIADAS
jgi:multiple sugar transport system substrate-binding protein